MSVDQITYRILLGAIVTAAALVDFRSRKIPNWLTFPAMAVGMAWNLGSFGGAGLLFSVKGAGVGIALLLIPYMMRAMGAGDVKLMGAVGAFLGAEGVFQACIISLIFGGIYAVILVIIKGNFALFLKRYWFMLRNLLMYRQFQYIQPSPGEFPLKLCFGLAIAVGTIFTIFRPGQFPGNI